MTKPLIVAWECNRCFLITRQSNHPGLCVNCRNPEHAALFSQELFEVADDEPQQQFVQGELFAMRPGTIDDALRDQP